MVAAVTEHRHPVGRRSDHHADVVDAQIAVRVDDVALQGVGGPRRRTVLEVGAAHVEFARDVHEHRAAEQTRRVVDEGRPEQGDVSTLDSHRSSLAHHHHNALNTTLLHDLHLSLKTFSKRLQTQLDLYLTLKFFQDAFKHNSLVWP